MRILGLGKPETVPPLTDAKAIELGGEILGEFFVFGTAITIVLIEYLRNASKQANKDITSEQRVLNLEKEQKALNAKLDKSNELIEQFNNFIDTQAAKTDDLYKKYEKLDEANRIKHSTKSSQTTAGKQLGRIIIPKILEKSASEDVTNSILYQCAEQAASEIRF